MANYLFFNFLYFSSLISKKEKIISKKKNYLMIFFLFAYIESLYIIMQISIYLIFYLLANISIHTAKYVLYF